VTAWRVAVPAADETAAAAAAEVLATQCSVTGFFEDGPRWSAEGWSAARPDAALLQALLALVGSEAEIAVERVAPRDWRAANEASFPPVAIGRYVIHGSHVAKPVLPGKIGLLIDAATAFGTGEHPSTRGCLLALDRIARGRLPARVLDMGCGTGVLAIAAAKTFRSRTEARDNDPEAVRVARDNIRRNGVARFASVRRSDGYRDPRLRRKGPFDLVFANILARPLALMAKDLRRALAPGGIAVLSGLLARQEPAVLAAHRLQGLRCAARIALDGWHTLVLRAPPARS
jgi:ribosomal protein L11 methyltransferase